MVSIFARTFIIYLILSITMKIMGKREIGELDVGELVSTLLISEIAAIPIDDPDLPLLNAIIPIIFILSLEILLSYGKTRFKLIKNIMEGKPVYLIYKGRIQQKAMRENRITVSELLCEIRMQGISDLEQVRYAILEQNGQISVLKKENRDMTHTVIIDGQINKDELVAAGFSEGELISIIEEEGVDLEDVFLMTVNDGKCTEIVKKNENC